MKLLSFEAKKIYGVFDFNIDFNKDINIIIGKNGTGKTTLLKIIIAIFSKDYIYLSKVKFQYIKLTFQNDFNEVVSIVLSDYFVKKSNDNKIEVVDYRVSSEELNCDYVVSIRDDKLFELVREESKNGEEELLKIETPMFLGLDRRFVNTKKNFHESARNFLFDFDDEVDRFKDEPLEAIKELILNVVSKNRSKLFSYNTKLRNNLLKIFLEEIPSDIKITEEFLVKLFSAKDKFNKIQDSIKNLMLSEQVISLINQRLFDYSLLTSDLKNKFDSLSSLQNTEAEIAQAVIDEISHEIRNGIEDFIRLSKVLDALENFQIHHRDIFKKVNLFKKLVNNFFEGTDKSIHISGIGNLKVKINENLFDLDILSSGERQIIILIGNLIFNESVSKRKIFIIDEPELSLHIYWQEIFLNSLIEGSEDIQFIIATHSPSIVAEYSDFIIETNNKLENIKG